MKKNNLMAGTLILSIGAVLAKIFSAIYRIVLTRILGGVGIGIYQLIFPFYSLCVVLVSAGIPMAISKVISKHQNNEKLVLKKSLVFTLIIATIITFIFVVSAKGLSWLQGESELTLYYLILSPTIIVVGATSVLRGYFQGKHNFIPSAISNILEQFAKLLVGLILSLCLLPFGILASILGAIIGIVMSEITSLVVLLMFIKKEKIKSSRKNSVLMKDIIKDIIPITLTNIVLPIATFIDSILVVNLLSKNFPHTMSVFLYGLESGAVSSLISIPTIFSFAIASVILPNLTKLKNGENKSYRLSFALRTILIITIPCIICFSLIPNRLIEFLYHNRLNSYGVDGTSIASRLLTISGAGVVFLAINQIYSSCLQAVDLRYVAIRNLSIGVVLKFIIEILFMANKFLNIYTLAIANSVCYITAMVLNHLEIKQNFRLKFNFTFTFKLIICNCLMLLSMLFIMSFNRTYANTFLAGIVAVLVYFISLILTKIFTKKDRAMLKYKL